MSTGQPVIPDPDAPKQPGGPVSDPKPEGEPDRDDAYDEAVEESFPASDPPAASEPGVP